MNEWTRGIHREAFRAYNTATGSLTGNARQLRAVAEGRGAIHAVAPYRSTSSTSTHSLNHIPEITQ
jgi:hypothetical protein